MCDRSRSISECYCTPRSLAQTLLCTVKDIAFVAECFGR
ncbi:hypothetical protein AVDCRST_MAG84-1323 [uncultured Microcoleus sp.]|uniref:Uncharacterized protein n=1 Tax=uncultured Microcoleus sp. TaxID=259945 RepID=A0A6J4L1M4_9CYAN|nr:hypothetical protein AVDCRST_MAG84-1323 [uncultured Microcoleus sp.]